MLIMLRFEANCASVVFSWGSLNGFVILGWNDDCRSLFFNFGVFIRDVTLVVDWLPSVIFSVFGTSSLLAASRISVRSTMMKLQFSSSREMLLLLSITWGWEFPLIRWGVQEWWEFSFGTLLFRKENQYCASNFFLSFRSSKYLALL